MATVKSIGLVLVSLATTLSPATPPLEVVAVVSARNPTTTLTKSQLVDIFLDRTRQFPDGRPAEPVDQSEGSAARARFYLTFSGWSPAQIKAYWSKIIFTGRGQPPPDVRDSREVKAFIAEHPNAIGYIEAESVDSSVKVLQVN